jgi:hypothetical protein
VAWVVGKVLTQLRMAFVFVLCQNMLAHVDIEKEGEGKKKAHINEQEL